MPTYSYHCIACANNFEVIRSRSEYSPKEKCPLCKKKSKTHRRYDVDIPVGAVKLSWSEIKTVGHLAERNTEMMSDDQKLEKYMKDNAYKKNKIPRGELPSGMTHAKRPDPVDWGT